MDQFKRFFFSLVFLIKKEPRSPRHLCGLISYRFVNPPTRHIRSPYLPRAFSATLVTQSLQLRRRRPPSNHPRAADERASAERDRAIGHTRAACLLQRRPFIPCSLPRVLAPSAIIAVPAASRRLFRLSVSSVFAADTPGGNVPSARRPRVSERNKSRFHTPLRRHFSTRMHAPRAYFALTSGKNFIAPSVRA